MARAIALTARRAIGRMPFPLKPPYVVFFSFPTAGHALESGWCETTTTTTTKRRAANERELKERETGQR